MQRAIKDLCLFADAQFFEEVATGISHIVDNATRLDAAACTLSAGDDRHTARIVGNLAEEEAVKTLILLDAVRCPRDRSAERARALGYFYNHLAKGIYVQAYHWHLVNFAEVARHVELERQQFYLDGPNDVDWIFPNHITQQREDDLYVGYVRGDSDEAGQGERYWTRPHHGLPLLPYLTPPAIRVGGALHRTGATTAEGLTVVAEIWRASEPTPRMGIDELRRLNWRTLETLEERGLLAANDGETNALIRDRWLFPLWSLDLRKKTVDRATLREIRDNWAPDW